MLFENSRQLLYYLNFGVPINVNNITMSFNVTTSSARYIQMV